MELIVLVDSNYAIGYKDDLLVRIKADLNRFKEITDGHIVVYGRRTLETFPGQQVLENRKNWVLSRNPNYCVDDATMFRSLDDLLEATKAVEAEGKKVFVIGGASVYRSLLEHCSIAHVTELEKAFEEADVYFPRIDQDPNWKKTWESERMEAGKKSPFYYRFVRYEKC